VTGGAVVGEEHATSVEIDLADGGPVVRVQVLNPDGDDDRRDRVRCSQDSQCSQRPLSKGDSPRSKPGRRPENTEDTENPESAEEASFRVPRLLIGRRACPGCGMPFVVGLVPAFGLRPDARHLPAPARLRRLEVGRAVAALTGTAGASEGGVSAPAVPARRLSSDSDSGDAGTRQRRASYWSHSGMGAL